MTLSSVPNASAPQVRRRPGRPPSAKRLALAREMPGKVRATYRRSLDPCDNSNDSGLGFDHNLNDPHHVMGLAERLTWTGDRAEAKRPRLDIKQENEDLHDGYNFPDAARTCKDQISLIRTAPVGSVPSLSITTNGSSSSGRAVPRCIPLSTRQSSSAPIPLTTQLNCSSRYIDVTLTIVKQPEQQHRARYQTEGSRGAVKDRDGNGFPIVQLNGYYKPATLQVFIGTDVGKVSPHMFYQACKVSGKNSTPCLEKKIDGTCVIELQLDPSKEMSATCDCVGILKERNVDVEHRFPDQLGNRSKKKSTRCRMIFRTTILLDDGTQETLQVCSQPIVCTQPPGVPEICKKSLTSCPAGGGLELFVLGKNFLKDTKVYFQLYDDGQIRWEQAVSPDKEYLQQTHFVCVVPPYRRTDITEPVSVRLCVVSSGKTSECHQFVYTPVNGAMPSVHMESVPQVPSQPFFKGMMWPSALNKREQDLDMMPPPDTSMVPLSTRRSSISVPSTSEVHPPPLHCLKQEYLDESSNGSIIDQMDLPERYRHISESSLDVQHGDSNMSMINENSMDMMNANSMMSHLNENSNMSMANEDSMDIMVRKKSISRQRNSICENSMDMHNSNMAAMNEDSSCSTAMHCNNSVMPERLVLPHQRLLTPQEQQHRDNGIDLRMKMPMVTASDLMCSNSPSIAIIQRFDADSNLLAPQNAQSVENFLNRIENKNHLGNIPQHTALKATEASQYCPPKMMTAQTNMATSTTQSMNQMGPRPIPNNGFMPHAMFNSPPQTVGKVSSEIRPTPPIITTTVDSGVVTPINTLDALVNATVESHVGSPPRVEQEGMKNKMPMVTATAASHVPNVIMTSQDVMLTSQTSLMVPPMITTGLTSPQQEISQANSVTSDAILNNRLSPSLMCRTATAIPSDTFLPTSTPQANLLAPPSVQGSPESITNLHSPIPVPTGLMTEPEKVVLLEAAVDLLQTQKKICEMTTALNHRSPERTLNEPLSQLTPGNKKNEDRMIPQGFPNLTENELINFINPSCFDQGNVNYP